MIVFCQDKRRRDAVLRTPDLNGIDYLEVMGDPGCGKQLALTFLKDARALNLVADNVQLSGDTALSLTSIQPATNQDPLTLTIDLGKTGDFSRYTLALVTSLQDPDPPRGIDPQLSSVSFSFKAGCPTPVDCLPTDCCPQTPRNPPDIHYLARDYDGFRQAMLDRMAVLAADVGRDPRRRHGRRNGRDAGLRRRPRQLSPGRGEYGGLHRHRPKPHLPASPRAPGGLPGQ